MPGRLDGKSVIITGASSGQGRVAAQRFAEEGARLVLADKDDEGLAETESLINTSGAELLRYSGDLTQEDVNEAMVALAVKSYGGLNAIYTPAGLVKFASAHELTLEDWKFVVDFELTMTFLACKHALRAMKDNGGGSIINVSSTSGIRGSNGHAAHAATKMGVVGFTRQIAVEYGPYSVRCNAIAPGYIAYAPGQLRVARQSTNNPQIDHIPLRRHCSPEDTSTAALFLASDESAFISGQVIVVDGAASIS
jgi:NAD(P)-dependent dehydrogenase (short-subunit alcohol dehydrogenase family)